MSKILVSKEELNKIIEAADVICLRCVEDTLNHPEVCDSCPVRKLCDAIEETSDVPKCCDVCNFSEVVGDMCVCGVNNRVIDVKEGHKPHWCPCNASNTESSKEKE